MKKLGKRTTTTITLMVLVAVIILGFYYYFINRTDPIKDAANNLSEYEKIMSLDLDEKYPETPREVTKTFARIMKALYNNPKEEEIEPLGRKIRLLYAGDFLLNNQEGPYLEKLREDIKEWKDEGRRITNYLLVHQDLEEMSEIDGVPYAVNYVSYTIKEKGKFTETWKVLLRQEQRKWRIVGWEFVPEDSIE